LSMIPLISALAKSEGGMDNGFWYVLNQEQEQKTCH